MVSDVFSSVRARALLAALLAYLLGALSTGVLFPGACAAASHNQASPADPARNAGKHVLVLYSTVFLPAYRQHSTAMLATLEAAGVGSAEIHYEFLELGRRMDPGYHALLEVYLAEKYRDVPVGAVITLDGSAQNFLLARNRTLFPGVPLVSVLAPVVIERPVPGRRVVQIPSRGEFAGTLAAARKLFPGTKRVFFVVGASDIEKKWLELAREAFSSVPEVAFEHSSGLSREAMLARAASLPGDAVVLYMSFYRDAEGATFVPLDVARQLASLSPRPVFGLYDTLIGTGVLGGAMNSYEYEGRHCAMLALEFLAGDGPRDELTVIPCLNRPMFDWPQLTRWGLGAADLPEGSLVLNRPTSIWEQHRGAVLGAAASMAILVGMVLALAIISRERTRAEARLRRSERDLKAILDNMPSLIGSWDRNLRNRFANHAYKAWFGFDPERMPGMHVREVLGEKLFVLNLPYITEALAGKAQTFERAIPSPDGAIVRHSLANYVPDVADGEVQGFYALLTDITPVKAAEQALLASLKEKETLLKEIHHRVKNNLQVICSLLSLQEQRVKNPDALRILADSQSRVMSMALVHDQLYRSQDLSGIDMRGYLEQLLQKMRASYQGRRAVTVSVDVPACRLSVEQAIPFGLVMNELATNAFKHAFPGRENGAIAVTGACQGDRLRITFQDDGVGLPDRFDLAALQSLGLQIVQVLAQQLSGTLAMESGPGARFVLEFPLGAGSAARTA